MKRILIMMLLLMATMGANAQNMYRVTGTNVNMRKGAGRNYAVLIWYDWNGIQKWQLGKTDVVRYLGQKKNGFMYVEAYQPTVGSSGVTIERGWVSADYLKLMTRKCPNCNGRGYFNSPCNDYPNDGYGHPHACNCQHELLTPSGNWPGDRQMCHKCNGAGYL